MITTDVEVALDAVHAGANADSRETPQLEFKESRGRSDREIARRIAKAAICFANAEGGVVVVGVADEPGGSEALTGCELDPDYVRRRIYELSNPPLLVDVVVEHYRGVRLLVVSVLKGVVVHADQQGRVYKRFECRCLSLDPAGQQRLSDERQGVDPSARLADSRVEDVDGEALARARRLLSSLYGGVAELADEPDRQLLRGLGVANGKGRLLVAGEVLFCRTDGEAADSRIVYQFKASQGAEPRTVERLTDPLLTSLDRVFELVSVRQETIPLDLPGGQQIRIHDFPRIAVREVVVNAVIHRDYRIRGPVTVEHSPDQFRVTSPGSLVPGITPENILTHTSKPRNHCLVKAVRTLGLAEEIGRGVDRVYREMISAGREPPRITNAPDHVDVVLEGGPPNKRIVRFVAGLAEETRADTDALLLLHYLCRNRTIEAEEAGPLLQRSVVEAERSLRTLAREPLEIIEPTRRTARHSHPTYRLREDVLKALGPAVPYSRRTQDTIDRRVIEHLREYERITNRTVRNLLNVGVHRASYILRDLRKRGVIVKAEGPERGPGVEYLPGPGFPDPGLRQEDAVDALMSDQSEADLTLLDGDASGTGG